MSGAITAPARVCPPQVPASAACAQRTGTFHRFPGTAHPHAHGPRHATRYARARHRSNIVRRGGRAAFGHDDNHAALTRPAEQAAWLRAGRCGAATGRGPPAACGHSLHPAPPRAGPRARLRRSRATCTTPSETSPSATTASSTLGALCIFRNPVREQEKKGGSRT